jgi:hypothetical protein
LYKSLITHRNLEIFLSQKHILKANKNDWNLLFIHVPEKKPN